jgi:hypothetical protein
MPRIMMRRTESGQGLVSYAVLPALILLLIAGCAVALLLIRADGIAWWHCLILAGVIAGSLLVIRFRAR